MLMAIFLVMSGILFYFLLRPPYSTTETTKADVTDGLSFEMTKPMLLKDPYTAQEAKSSG